MASATSSQVVADTAPPALRLIAEAEDFAVESGEWRVVPWGENYFASTFAGVRSVERGSVPFKAGAEGIEVALPLDVADMLLLDASR